MLRHLVCTGLMMLAAADAVRAQPANDECANATQIGEGVFTIDFSGSVDTVAGEGPLCGNVDENDIWYLYTPPVGGIVVIDTCDSATNGNRTRVATYSATCGGAQLGCSTDTCGSDATLNHVVSAGVPLIIRVTQEQGATPVIDGVLKVTLYSGAAPANDTCLTATLVTAGTTSFNNVGATTETPPTCSAGSVNDVWFRYVPTRNCGIEISSCGSDFTPAISIHSSCGGASIACSITNVTEVVEPNCRSVKLVYPGALGGTTYYIRFATTNSARIGLGSMTIQEVLPPSNNDCANALAVSSGTYVWSNIGATTDYTGTGTCGTSVRDIWFRFIATVNGRFTARACFGSSAGQPVPRMSLHTTCGVAEISGSCKSNPCGLGLSGSVEEDVTVGEVVYVRLAFTSAATSGYGTLVITEDQYPANDTCATAFDAVVGSNPWNNRAARTDGSAATCTATSFGRDVWYRYMSNIHGTAVFRRVVQEDIGTPLFTIFESCSGAEVGCGSSATVFVDNGVEYLVRLATQNTNLPYTRPDSAFTIEEFQTPENDLCADAITVSEGAFIFDNTGANTDGADASCETYDDGADVWFEYTPSMTGVATLSTCDNGTQIDTVLSVHPSCSDDAELACNDDSCLSLQSRLTLNVVGGQAYIVRVAVTPPGAAQQGVGQLDISIAPPPCTADFNHVNGVTVQDIFDFLTAWLAGSPTANFNNVNGVTVQDIFDFLTAWLAGC